MQHPKLAGHVRYRWDAIREEHQLVFPEGMMVLNPSAAAIVQLCDGRTTDELVAALGQSCEGCVAADVHQFLGQLERKRLLCDR